MATSRDLEILYLPFMLCIFDHFNSARNEVLSPISPDGFSGFFEKGFIGERVYFEFKFTML